MTQYCNNECDNEATEYFVNDDGGKIYLCHTCMVAFRWGQVHPDSDTDFIEDDEVEDNELEDFANKFQRLHHICRQILGSGEALKEHILNYTGDRHSGWELREKMLVFFNTGFESFHKIPDWDKARNEIIANYEIEKIGDIEEAFSDYISQYRMYSRG